VLRREGGTTGRDGGTTGGREETVATRPSPRKVHLTADGPVASGPGQAPPVVPSSRPPVAAPDFSMAGLQAIWPEVVEAGRAESRFLAEALASCTVVSAAPPNVVVRLAVDQAHLLAPIEKGRRSVEAFLQVRLGVPVTLTVESGAPPGGGERPRRMSEASLRTERLKGLRGTDPALDTAVDELDLEIVDERPPAGGR